MTGYRDASDALDADQDRILALQWLELQTLGYLIAHGDSLDDLIWEWAQRLTAAELAGARTSN